MKSRLFTTLIHSNPMKIFPIFHRNFDILAGGLFPHRNSPAPFTLSKPYYQDDFTWCVQKSKNWSMFLNLFAAASVECWFLIIFGVGLGSAFVMYIMIQFDLEYSMRNARDWHYMTWLVGFPMLIGFNQRFQPKSNTLRIFYGFLLIIMVFAWQTFFLLGFRYFKEPIQRPQIATTTELANSEFRLAGSIEVKSLISYDQRVRAM